MGERGRIIFLALIMAFVVIVTSGVALGIIYQTSFNQQRQALVSMAQSQARLIEAIARFDEKFRRQGHPAGPSAATLSQVRDAHRQYPGIGATGEFTLAHRYRDEIVFILRHRHFDLDLPMPVPFDGANAEPMRRALSGKSGTVIGLDYRGKKVLAAYEPVGILSLGIVAKIDMDEIQEPFINAGIQVSMIALFAIVAGTGLFFRISNPLIDQIVREKERAEKYLDIAEAIIVILDDKANVVKINRRGCDVLGYSEEEIVGKNWIETFIPEELRKTIYSVHTKVASGEIEPVEHFENDILTKDGELRTIAWHNAYYSDTRKNITGSLSSGQDITDRKRGEIELLKAKEEADQASIAKSHLMANISHELRTPLNAIIGFSGSIREEIYGPLRNEKYQEYMEDINQSGRHLLDLINDILDVSALEAGAMEMNEEEVDLSEVVEASIHMVSQLAAVGDVTVSSSISADTPHIYVDKRRIKQILINLLNNAVKFTPKGGNVWVSALQNKPGSLEISVADTGIGMNSKELEKALSKFGQVDSGLNRKHEGTGLGLPLTKGLIEMHGGTMDILSGEGKGTVITLKLPKERVLEIA